MTFTPWTAFVDFCLIAVLLLIGQFLRAKIKILQMLFIPAALIAGILGLVLGPGVLNWIPLSSSNNMSTYSAILIVLVFASMPLGKARQSMGKMGESIGNMFIYSAISDIGQYAIAMVIGLLVLVPLFAVPEGFGVLLPAGWVGGPGTAVAIGTTFKSYGWEDAMSLGLISATLGTLFGIIGGVILIKHGAKKRYTKFISSFKDMDPQERSGLIKPADFQPMGNQTVSANVIDPLAFHLALILVAAAGGYYVCLGVKALAPKLTLPTFSMALICAYILNAILRKTGGIKYVDDKVMGRIGSSCTDLLVAFAIASIKISVVVKYWMPLTILILVGGVMYSIFLVLFVGPRMYKYNWFEKSIFSFGWITGVMATSMILLRIVDPEFKSGTLEDFAITSIPMGIIDALMITFVPIAVSVGYAYHWMGISCGIVLALLVVAWRLKWIYKHGADRDRLGEGRVPEAQR